jgi:cytochrome b6-f complex iron-sulfur subunit
MTSKQTYPDQEPEVRPISRRGFLQLGWRTLNALAVLELVGAGVLFLRSRAQEGKYGSMIKAGLIDEFPPGSVTDFPEGNFFLARAQDGGFLAMYKRCPHLGCTVDWVEDKERFYCPCHASSFTIYGDHENNASPRALDTFPVSFKDGAVVVDTTKVVKRESFDASQLAYR